MINPPEAEPAIPPITLAATESSGLSRALGRPPGLCYPAETTLKRWVEFGRFRSHRGWGRTGYDTQIRDGSRRRSSDFVASPNLGNAQGRGGGWHGGGWHGGAGGVAAGVGEAPAGAGEAAGAGVGRPLG